jgi:hypothetical protein
MTAGTPRIKFREYLPEVIVTGGLARVDTAAGDQAVAFMNQFLAPIEALFEELQGEIEGTPATAGAVPVAGGIPDIFAPALTPPAELIYRGSDPFGFLNYLASWIGMTLRPERSADWNRQFIGRAIQLELLRGTSAGLDALLRAWLSGDLLTTNPPMLVLTDLTRAYNQVDTTFQLDVNAVLGVQTALGEGPPFFFVVDLVADASVRELRNPVGLDVLQRATRTLLAAEKPAHTYYQLRIRTATMQLAPADMADAQPSEIYAQLEDASGSPPLLGTTLLWDEPWVFNSDAQPGSG